MLINSVKSYSNTSLKNNYEIKKNNINTANPDMSVNTDNKGLSILGIYNRVSFGASPAQAASVARRVQKAVNYLTSLSENGIRRASFESFSWRDLESIEDIALDIPVFSHLKARDLAEITSSFDSVLLQRGCSHRCSHCGVNAPAKVKTMTWENFTKLTDGISTLKKRLGFNPFSYTDSIGREVVASFWDSDPMMLKIRDSKNQVYDIVDAAKEFYEKTGAKFIITTAGWPQKDTIAQKAAEKLAKNLQYFSHITVSIHPFHGIMTKALENKKIAEGLEASNPEKAEEYFMKYLELREKYISCMSNVLETFRSLFKNYNAFIALQHLDYQGYEGFKDLDSKSSRDLFSAISVRVSNREEYQYGQTVIPINISSSGRAVSYFKEMNYIPYEARVNIIDIDGRILRHLSSPGHFTDKPLKPTGYSLNFDV